jgi:Tol biopolymer transport system component
MTASLIRFWVGTALFVVGLVSAPFMISGKPLHIGSSAGSVTSLAWSSDGHTLAIGSSDDKVDLWDVQNNKVRRSIKLGSNLVSLAWSPDSKMLASGTWTENEQPSVILWDADTGTAVQTIRIPTRRLRALAWSPDGKLVSIGLEENTILFWNIKKDIIDILNVPSDGTLSLAWSPDGQLLAAGLQDGTVAVIAASTYELLRRLLYFPSGAGYIADIAWSSDGTSLASAVCDSESSPSATCHLFIWDPTNGQAQKAFQSCHYDATSLDWSPSGRYIAVGYLSGDITLYNSQTGKLARMLKTSLGQTLVAWAPNGQRLAAGTENGSVLVWNLP